MVPVEDKRLVDSLDSGLENEVGSQMVANDNGAAEAAPQVIDIHGAPRWNRTSNLLIKSV